VTWRTQGNVAFWAAYGPASRTRTMRALPQQRREDDFLETLDRAELRPTFAARIAPWSELIEMSDSSQSVADGQVAPYGRLQAVDNRLWICQRFDEPPPNRLAMVARLHAVLPIKQPFRMSAFRGADLQIHPLSQSPQRCRPVVTKGPCRCSPHEVK